MLPAGSEPLTLTAVGDIMMGSTGQRTALPPGDGEGLFQEVSEHLRGGDLVFGNLEGALSDGEEGGKCREDKGPWCFEFRTPTRYVRHLKHNGFNVVNLANNHAWDFGPEGIRNTLETLQEAGIKAAGGTSLAFFEIRGKRIVVAGFSYKPSKYSYSILEIPQAVEIVRQLKANHDLVIVSFHGERKGARPNMWPTGARFSWGRTGVMWFDLPVRWWRPGRIWFGTRPACPAGHGSVSRKTDRL